MYREMHELGSNSSTQHALVELHFDFFRFAVIELEVEAFLCLIFKTLYLILWLILKSNSALCSLTYV